MSAMALSELTSRDAVLAAIEEFRRLGREAFLTKYGLGRLANISSRMMGANTTPRQSPVRPTGTSSLIEDRSEPQISAAERKLSNPYWNDWASR